VDQKNRSGRRMRAPYSFLPDQSLGASGYLIIALVGFSIALIAAVVASRQWFSRIPTRQVRAAPPAMWRLLAWLIGPLEVSLGAFVSPRWNASLESLIVRAGLADRLTAISVIAAQFALLVLAMVGVYFVSFTSIHLPVSIGVLLCLAAWSIPFIWVRDRAIRIGRLVARQLPFYLDLLAMSVEAGTNITMALQQATQKGPAGALRDEFVLVLRKIGSGSSRASAFESMAQRLQNRGVSSFIAALLASEKQGSALSPLFRAQAEQRRTERFQLAEKLAMQAPIKMLFPLLMLIFPGTFIVLLFPIAMQLMRSGWLK
jgi:tight adherence protein C